MIRVKDEIATINAIINDRVSISRFGDGELKLCFNRRQISQEPSDKIKRRLRKILRSVNENLLIGIPRIYGKGAVENMSERKRGFWKKYTGDEYIDLYDPNKTYYSSFISRPDAAPEIDNAGYWDQVKQIWKGRDVVLMQGEGRQFHRSTTLLTDVDSLKVLYGPRKNAFSFHKKLMGALLGFDKDVLLILSLGPEATMLAHDLCVEGHQALDMGHAGMFYAHIHPKNSKYTGEPYDVDK